MKEKTYFLVEESSVECGRYALRGKVAGSLIWPTRLSNTLFGFHLCKYPQSHGCARPFNQRTYGVPGSQKTPQGFLDGHADCVSWLFK